MPTPPLPARAFSLRLRWPVRLRAATLILLLGLLSLGLAFAEASAQTAAQPPAQTTAPPPAATPAAPAPTGTAPPTPAPPSAAATAADGMMMLMLSEGRDRMAGFRGKLAKRLRATPAIPSAIVATLKAQSPTGEPAYFLQVIALTFALMAAGHGVQHLVYQRPVARRLLPPPAEPRPGGSILAARFPVW